MGRDKLNKRNISRIARAAEEVEIRNVSKITDEPKASTPIEDYPPPFEPTQVYEKEIVYDPETRDFAMYLDGDSVGFARTYQEAEQALDELVFELLNGQYFQEAA
jgi:hypothetical protein